MKKRTFSINIKSFCMVFLTGVSLAGSAQTTTELYSDFSGTSGTLTFFNNPGPGCSTFDLMSVGVTTPYVSPPYAKQWKRIGTPSPSGTSDILLVAGAQKSEGLFTDFNFVVGNTYTIEFGVKSVIEGPVDIQAYATTNLIQTPTTLLPSCQELHLDGYYAGLPYWYTNQDQGYSYNTPAVPLLTPAGSISVTNPISGIVPAYITYTPQQYNAQVAFYPKNAGGTSLVTLAYVKIVRRRPECIPDFTYSVNTTNPNLYKFTPNATTGQGYNWTFGDGSPGISTIPPATVSHTYTDGDYMVSLRTGGPNPLSVCRKDKAICVGRLEVPGEPEGMHPLSEAPLCDANFEVTFNTEVPNTIRVSANNSQASSYTWNFSDGTPAQTMYSTEHTYAVPGAKKICLTAFFPAGQFGQKCTKCIDICLSDFGNTEDLDDDGKKKIPLSISDQSKLQVIQVYPNPVTAEMKIDVSSSEERLDIKLYDLMGRLLKKKTEAAPQAGTRTIVVNTTDLVQGFYIVEISDGTSIVKTKISKE